MRMRADHVGIGELAKVVVWGTACEHAFDEIDERLPGYLALRLSRTVVPMFVNTPCPARV